MTTAPQHSATCPTHPGQKPGKPLEALRALAVVALPVILAVALQRISIEQPLKAGDAAPNLVLQDMNGGTISLPALYSRRLAVLFFSADCPHCRTELENADKLRQILGGRIQFLLITTSDRAKVKSLVDSLGIRITVAIDDKGRAQSAFGVFTVPAWYLINTRGAVHTSSFGERALDARREQLESFLRASANGAHVLAGSRQQGV